MATWFNLGLVWLLLGGRSKFITYLGSTPAISCWTEILQIIRALKDMTQRLKLEAFEVIVQTPLLSPKPGM